MKIAVATLESQAVYTQSRYHGVEKLDKESHKDYETRTWRDRLHTDESGQIFIPPMAFKNCLSEAAKFLSIQIPGKGKATYTKHFEAGVMCVEPVFIGCHKDDVIAETLFVPSDGVRGSNKRVEKTFPVIPNWTATVKFSVLDETITKDVFLNVLSQAGKFIGLGAFRPRNNGYRGRFKVNELEWSDFKL